MMGNVFKLARWEWFKLRRRRMPWILLGILLLFSQLAVWGMFLNYSRLQASGGQVLLPGGTGGTPDRGGQFQMVSCNALETDPSAVLPAGTAPEVVSGLLAQCQQQAGHQQDQLQQLYGLLTLPGSLSSAFGISGTIGLILLAVLTASAIGSDYGLGTLRPILVRGMGRVQYLAGKFLMLIGAAAGALLVVSVITAISSLIATGMAAVPSGGAAATTSWADAGIALSRTWVSFIPYIALTATVTLLTRSTAAGMGIGLGYYFTEALLVALLSALFDWFGTVADYLLISNINAFASGGTFVIVTTGGSGGNDIGLVQAGIVLAIYTVVLVGVAIRLFRQRDVTGANGG